MGENSSRKKRRKQEQSATSSSESSTESAYEIDSSSEDEKRRKCRHKRRREEERSRRSDKHMERTKRERKHMKKRKHRGSTSSSRRSKREGKRKYSDSNESDSGSESVSDDSHPKRSRESPEDVVKGILQEFPNVAGDLEQLLQMIDDGQAVDIRGLSEKLLVKHLRKLFLSLSLKETGDHVFLLPSKAFPTLETVGPLIRSRSQMQLQSQEVHQNDELSKPLDSGVGQENCNANLSLPNEVSSGHNASLSLPSDNANAYNANLSLPAEEDTGPKKRVIGPAIPSAELLAAAAKLTEAQAELSSDNNASRRMHFNSCCSDLGVGIGYGCRFGGWILMDRLRWNGDSKGAYKVSSGYNFLNSTVAQHSLWPWKQIWRTKAPLKVACLSWLLAKEAVLTHENLRKRNRIIVTHCCLCGEAAETVGHLFLHCRITDQLWKIFINLRGIKWTMPSKIVDTLSSWEEAGKGAKNRSYWRTIPACIWWTIWKERNNRCFEDRSRTVQKIKTDCILLLCFWCTKNYPTDEEDILDVLDSC